jgi:plasmid replication initiation protein
MTDLRDNQLVLPLQEEPHYKELVKQNWQFTFTKQYMTSVYTKRVVGLIVAQMKEEGEMRDYYQIRALDIIRETGLAKPEVYRRLRVVVRELALVVFFFENEEKQRIIPRHLLDTTRKDNVAGYNDGVLTVAFNPALRDEIMLLAHYSRYELSTYMRFSSWYSMRLWEVLYAYRDLKEVEFTIANYRDFMGCGVVINEITGEPKTDKKGKVKYIKYPTHSDMINYTTQEPLKEFKGTELEFTVEPMYERLSGKGRPPIVKVKFHLLWGGKSDAEKIQNWCEGSEKFQKIYERLKVWKVDDDKIVKYAKVIGVDELNKLMYYWQSKDAVGSKNKIDNHHRYCNSEIIRVGKEILEKNRQGGEK